jgi:general secretion pathway protein D
VTLKIKIEVTSLNGNVNISGVTEPIVAQKVVDQVIRLHEGEASILGGIQDKQEQVNWSGIPGLSSIPILKYLFGSKDHTISDDELVFLIVPHIVRSQSLDRVNLRTIDTGPGQQSVELRHVPEEAPNSNPAPPPVSVPPPASPAALRVPPAHSTFGTVPAQSALAAAPALLAQMTAVANTNGNTASNAMTAPPAIPPPAGMVNLMLNPPGRPVAVGATFQVPIELTGGVNIASIPLQLQYDPARLSLVNVAPGDLLSRDGQAVALVHRDDGPGTLTVDVARPPGAAGVSGAGVACVLSFQARTAGQTVLAITRPGAVNSAQQQVPATGSRINITVQ